MRRWLELIRVSRDRMFVHELDHVVTFQRFEKGGRGGQDIIVWLTVYPYTLPSASPSTVKIVIVVADVGLISKTTILHSSGKISYCIEKLNTLM